MQWTPEANGRIEKKTVVPSECKSCTVRLEWPIQTLIRILCLAWFSRFCPYLISTVICGDGVNLHIRKCPLCLRL